MADAASELLHSTVRAYLSVYHRHRVTIAGELPAGPVMIVGNHGFGTLTDLNVHAAYDAIARTGRTRRPVTLVHQVAWTFGLGAVLEELDCRPASADAVRAAFDEGRDVLVFPGGDLEIGKAWPDRDRVSFHGRSGFARLAADAGVPVVPVVTAGAGESLLVLSEGRGLARLLHLKQLLRFEVFPVSVSAPWGLSVGLVGLLPYLPAPTKLETEVLEPMWSDDESPEEYAARVETVMRQAMGRLTDGRRPLLGRR